MKILDHTAMATNIGGSDSIGLFKCMNAQQATGADLVYAFVLCTLTGFFSEKV